MLQMSVVAFLISVALSAAITWYYAKKKRFLSLVRPSQSSTHHTHTVPTPRVGGIAIFLSFLATLTLVLVWNASSGRFSFRMQSLLIVMPACAMFFLGLFDDIFSLGARHKLAGQILASMPLFWWGFHTIKVPAFVGGAALGWALAMGLAIFWVVSITNAFNLVDGVDGLAAGVGVLSTGVIFLACLIVKDGLLSLVAVVLAGALLGFLRFNFTPARIFLGDCGSLFTGCALGSLALALTLESRTPLAALALGISFGLPILDTVLAIMRRFLNGRPVFSPDREHIHHKLIWRGCSRLKAVIILYGISTLFSLAGATLLLFGSKAIPLVGVLVVALVIATVWQCGYLESSELRRIFYRASEQRGIVKNNLAIRRATEKLLEAGDFQDVCAVLRDAFENNDFDGVELSIISPTLLASIDRPFNDVTNGNLFYRWNNKRHTTLGNGGGPTWKLTVDLVTTGKDRIGFLLLRRDYTRQSLMVDINVLFEEFSTCLADTVARLIQTERPIPGVTPIPISSSAQAQSVAKVRYSI